MAKKFHTKRRKKHKLIKMLILILVCYFSFESTTYYVLKSQLATSNEEFLQNMLRDSNHYLLYQKSEENVIAKIGKYFMDFDLEQPLSLLGVPTVEEKEKEEMVYQKDPDATFVSNPVEKTDVSSSPQVYIYNTHQTESYSMKTLEPYNITPSVMMASYLMKEHFQKAGIETIVEETNISDYMKEQGYQYAKSYVASRTFVESILKKYPDLKLIIDLHRDAIPHDSSTITIGEKNTFGWYYINSNDKSPSWTGVEFLRDFLVREKRSAGPVAQETQDLSRARLGDVIQLRFSGDVFQHSPVVVQPNSDGDPAKILVAAHSADVDWRPLSTYDYQAYRVLHILGAFVP